MALAAFFSVVICQPTMAGEHAGQMAKDSVTIEHVQLVASPMPSSLSIFLVVWNGTERSVGVVDVASEAFGAVKVLNDDHGRSVPLSESGSRLVVPPRSELVMNEKWLHLTATLAGQALSPDQTVPVWITFADGRTQAVAASVLAPGTPAEDHHHGT